MPVGSAVVWAVFLWPVGSQGVLIAAARPVTIGACLQHVHVVEQGGHVFAGVGDEHSVCFPLWLSATFAGVVARNESDGLAVRSPYLRPVGFPRSFGGVVGAFTDRGELFGSHSSMSPWISAILSMPMFFRWVRAWSASAVLPSASALRNRIAWSRAWAASCRLRRCLTLRAIYSAARAARTIPIATVIVFPYISPRAAKLTRI